MSSNTPTPTVGRIVHYVAYGTPNNEYPAGAHRAAIVTEVKPPWADDHVRIGLCILNPTGMFFTQGVPHDEDVKGPGTWHWPEREEA